MSLLSKVSEYDGDFKKFLLCVHKGFEKGARIHGEHSNKKMNLIREIKEELRDVACYAYFQFKKLNELERKLRRIE